MDVTSSSKKFIENNLSKEKEFGVVKKINRKLKLTLYFLIVNVYDTTPQIYHFDFDISILHKSIYF